jgi:DNA-binding transcriptional MerR regulator
VFHAAAIERIRFVKELQALGFTLDETIDVLRLADASGGTCTSAREHALAILARIDAKIAALSATRVRLASYVTACAEGTCALTEATPRVRLPLAPARRLGRE